MTTVAYKDGVMAADSVITDGVLKSGRLWKITRHDASGALLGVAGKVTEIVDYLNYFRRYGITKTKKFSLLESTGLIATVDGTVMLVEDSTIYPIEEEFFAIGSGAAIAMGAMRCGVSAIIAVKIACEIDLHSGFPVRALTHSGDRACTE
jgi:ATP-dependent protease HslVU (ClpYQ) peptidase subunit